VSVIIPTLDEAENIGPLITAILDQQDSSLGIEVIVADGGSTDGTRELVRSWEGSHPVRLLAHAEGDRGLIGAVLAGAKVAASEIVVVMDADFSHPPDRIPDLVRPIMSGACDMVIGSRYVSGGETPGWPLRRRVLSRAAVTPAWVLTDVRDPMSGFFAVRRHLLFQVEPSAEGFKIGLEVLVRGGAGLRVIEIPIVFRDRVRGTSKLGARAIMVYLQRVVVLAGGSVSGGTATRFGSVGLLGLAIDLLAFRTLLVAGIGLVSAHLMSFGLATLVNYVLNSRWTFRRAAHGSPEFGWRGYGRFLIVCLMALSLRGAVLASLVNLWGWSPSWAIVAAIGAAALVNYLGSAFFAFPREAEPDPDLRWRVAALGVVAYVLLLRAISLGLPELLPEEAYYWNYAQHLDIGYLDHPPMVAWLIWLGTGLFGRGEFGVRIGAFTCWLVTAVFCFRLTRDLFGKSAAFRAVLLLAVLPFFFGVGFFMTPDAPLVASWAGALYFLQLALLRDRHLAWWGVGACIGLGMLSKYTIALLVPAALVFMLIDRRARRWLLRPEPYAAALAAIVLFSPVLVWNANHGWASFFFQGARRLEATRRFSLHLLVGSALLLLTPVGLVGMVQAMFSRTIEAPSGTANTEASRRRRLFATVFTLVPLSVLVAFSLQHEVKLNWTGPLWLATLPALACSIVPSGDAPSARWWSLARAWRPTVAVAVLGYGLGVHYVVLGLPGVGYPGTVRPLIGWREFVRQVEELDEGTERRIGEKPLLVGMDKYFISSQLAFYGDGPHEVAGRHLFGSDSLMYEHWSPAVLQRGRALILLTFDQKDLMDQSVADSVQRLDPIEAQFIMKNGAIVGRFYYRVAHGYLSPPLLRRPSRALRVDAGDVPTAERRERISGASAPRRVTRHTAPTFTTLGNCPSGVLGLGPRGLLFCHGQQTRIWPSAERVILGQ
jgi:dolichol-phosphate mannosyltransferase